MRLISSSTASKLASSSLSSAANRASTPQLLRQKRLMSSDIGTIASGTDLTVSNVTWQRARPWYMSSDEGSNLASDNAVTMSELFHNRKVAVFGVPGPFTGVCTYGHVPPYMNLESQFKAKGVDELVCYSVSDPYAHYGWAKTMGVDLDKITFLADVDCEWAKEYGLDRDYTATSLGVRSARFSMLVEDGKVMTFNIVEEAEKDAEMLLGQV